MDKIKWGILGTANICTYGTIPGMKLSESCELYAIAGRNPEKVRNFKEKYGFEVAYNSYEELLHDENIQAVYIPLPNDIHLKWVKEALKNRKHVLCEKPMALNANEATEMFATASEYGVHLMEAYAYLHSPYVASLKADIESGIIGDVDYIESAFITQGYKEDFRLHKEYGGGAMYDLGCYCTTMILTLIDSEPEFVKAVAEFIDLGVDNNTSGIIRFKNGARASFNVGMILGENSNSRFDRLYIHGTKGSIRSDVEYNQAGEVSYKIFTNDGVIERKVSVPQNYSLEIENMSRCILYGDKLHVTPDFSIKNAELIDKVLKDIGYTE
ncbi:MAG: Gfo/Idh/MocA family oxidoreductase [Lachnospiraceae bacterium]|nr:Gfo/Idh/MocA family oxidoreductase [Lachnospiraceae bacterium]